MLNAIYKGKFREVSDLFKSNPDAISTTFENGKTALHVAITAGQLRVAKELITITGTEANSCQLKIKDESGNTALSFAARSGMMEIAKCLIEKNKDLLNIPDGNDRLPVQLACRAGHGDMARYLYRETPTKCLRGVKGFYLLEECVTKKMFGTRVKVDKGSVLSDGVGSVAAQRGAKLAPRFDLDHISRAARLQSELRWFKAVKGIVPQFYNYCKNNNGETPSQVFVNEHKQLLKEAEEWVKKTAESSSVVATLIIGIMFAVAFTVPVSDAISLFAATSSVLIFLAIFASRYAYEDFYKSLPVKLIVGISSLFISIAAMMVAFCVALFIMLQGHFWIIIPTTLFAGVPVIIWVLLLFPFLVELETLTFAPGIFDSK
ncbi:hypothetical protein SLEP1_g19074 [Rubroshorea leprosula]|nr:hypothetical protein SLEP1_g19074 [Rubroshorea leprosula]